MVNGEYVIDLEAWRVVVNELDTYDWKAREVRLLCSEGTTYVIVN